MPLQTINAPNHPSFVSGKIADNSQSLSLESFFKEPNNSFVVHQVKGGIESETTKKEGGGEETVEFMLQFDPATGQSTRIYVRTIDVPGDDDNKPGKGLSFDVPKELLTTNDPEKASKVATQYANVIVETALKFHEDVSPIYLACNSNYKWQALTEQKIAEAFLNRQDELQARGISVRLQGNLIFDPQKPEHSNKSASNTSQVVKSALQEKPLLPCSAVIPPLTCWISAIFNCFIVLLTQINSNKEYCIKTIICKNQFLTKLYKIAINGK